MNYTKKDLLMPAGGDESPYTCDFYKACWGEAPIYYEKAKYTNDAIFSFNTIAGSLLRILAAHNEQFVELESSVIEVYENCKYCNIEKEKPCEWWLKHWIGTAKKNKGKELLVMDDMPTMPGIINKPKTEGDEERNKNLKGYTTVSYNL